MKEIPLSQGKIALVDDEDYNYLNQFKWCAAKAKNTFYASRSPSIKNGGHKTRLDMHRVIITVPEGLQVDHIDGNGLNNQKINLRIVTHRGNCQNKHIAKSSIYPGVNYHKRDGVWESFVCINRRSKYLGSFPSEYEAFVAYLAALSEVGESVI